jgi:hypothetical protein
MRTKIDNAEVTSPRRNLSKRAIFGKLNVEKNEKTKHDYIML